MSEGKFNAAVEKLSAAYDDEKRKGYDYALELILNDKLTFDTLNRYRILAKKLDGKSRVRRELGINASNIFLDGFLEACNKVYANLSSRRDN
jgi:hypothetical protein